jgi:hypothetical protein
VIGYSNGKAVVLRPVAASASSLIRWQPCGPWSEIRTSQGVWEESWRVVVDSGEAEATRRRMEMFVEGLDVRSDRCVWKEFHVF